MMATVTQYLFVLLFVNPSFGQIKKVDAAPGTGNSGSSVPAENAVGGSRTEIPTLTQAQLNADNSRASQYIKSYEDFSKANATSPLVTAARAEVQIIRKCAVARSGSQYVIGSSRPMFCAGHPLSQHGGPQLAEGQRPLAAAADGFCTARPCSGVLAQNAQTILSAGHCTDGRTVENFCDEFVFVFNRTGGKTTFSSDEVFECDGGVSVDGTRTPNFNTHAADNVRDHAAFHLKRPVPATTAQPLSWRSTTSAIKPSESLYAVGHPQGAPRMISTLTQPHRLGGGSYSYLQAEGYVYGGNSGGPLLDSNGRLVGILASVDDNRHGIPSEREPLVMPPNGKSACRTQKANGALQIEAVGAGSQIDEAILQAQAAPRLEEAPVSPSVEH